MIYTSPFPHVVLDNFLDTRLFESLRKEYPSPEKLKKVGKVSSKNRFNFMRGSKSQEQLISNSLTWQEFDRYMKSNFIDEMLEIFDPSIKKYGASFDRKSLSCGYDISRAGAGYKRSCHLDRRHHLIAFLLYFNDRTEFEGEGGNLVLFNSKKREVWDKFPDRTTISPEKEIEPSPNRLVAFLNTYDSYHGITTMKNNASDRIFLYASIDDRTVESVWPNENVKVVSEKRRIDFINE